MKTKFWIALVIVFVSGGVIGYFSGQITTRHRMRVMLRRGPEHLTHMLVGRLEDELSLDSEQLRVAQDETGAMASEIHEVRRQHQEVFAARMDAVLKNIRPHLRPEQQQVLDGMNGDQFRPGRARKQAKP
jgi:hypothetical protein